MAQVSTIAMALASQNTPSVAIPKQRDMQDHSGTANYEKAASALLTPPSSESPEMAAHPNHATAMMSPPLVDITEEMDLEEERNDSAVEQGGMPLSRGALSTLDDAVTITPSMLAKHHLPGIMLGNGPRPIRYVMGELTQTVPGFSRIPAAKARRIVVAALESRTGGGIDGNVAFCKTGWGRWDAHIKGSSRDSAIGSFNEGNLSPPRSERSYAVSHPDSGVNMPAPHLHSKQRDHYSGGSWTDRSIREEDELDMDDMDPLEEAADKMSLDGDSSDDDSMDDDETDDEDWAAVGIDALRKASLPTSNAPRQPVRAVSVPYNGRFAQKSFSQRPPVHRSSQSTSLPFGIGFSSMTPAMATPEEKEAIAALIKMGSM